MIMMKKQHNDKNTNMSFLKKKIQEFVEERDWNKFHHPKELAISISLESAELLELFQWKDKKTLEEIKKNEGLMKKLQEEIADILIYALSFSNQLGIDLTLAIINKLNKNSEKYPKNLVKGKAKKYTYYTGLINTTKNLSGKETRIEEKWFELGKNKVASVTPLKIRKGVRYFICITTPYNYITCIDHNLWGVEPHNQNIIKKTSPRDIILFYIKSKKKFGIVCEITSNVFYDKSPVWKDGVYPYRIQIKPLFSSQYPKEIDQTLIENLDFIPRTDNKWGCVLQRSMLEISEEDFFTILNYLNDH